jgi:hypothetical protein
MPGLNGLPTGVTLICLNDNFVTVRQQSGENWDYEDCRLADAKNSGPLLQNEPFILLANPRAVL